MQTTIPVNRTQMADRLLMPKNLILVCGRATGKSWGYGEKLDRIVRKMPGSTVGLVTKTYAMAYTGTLQSAVQALGSFGYVRDGNYVLGKKPPAAWPDSLARIEKNENCITFSNGTKLVMFSQSEKGSVRGANLDFIFADEVLELDEEQFKKEAVPANRGNLEHFGKNAHHACYLHHGMHLTTSMPWTESGRWILKEADYYASQYGVRLFEVWNRMVALQMELLDTQTPAQFAECWNEIEQLRAMIPPRVSRDGTLFMLSNAFDNLSFLGLSYIKTMRENLTKTEFLIEVMNKYIDSVEGCFYALNAQKQIYYTALNEGAVRDTVARMGFNADSVLSLKSCAYDLDCDPNLPLEVCPDWGSAISLFVVCQTRKHEYDFSKGAAIPIVRDADRGREYHYQINEFFEKPDENGTAVIERLCSRLVGYYAAHPTKTIYFFRDRYGDHRNPNVFNNKSYNQQAVDALRKHGWRVIERHHDGMEPPQNEKYLLWGDILQEGDKCPVRFRINGNRCRYTVISMNNAPVKESAGKFEKDKSSERSSSKTPPEEATHFSDAADKIIWTKYGKRVGRKHRKGLMPMSLSKD